MVDVEVVAGGYGECNDLFGSYGEFNSLAVQSAGELERILIDINLASSCLGIHKSVLAAASELGIRMDRFGFGIDRCLLPFKPLVDPLEGRARKLIVRIKRCIKTALTPDVIIISGDQNTYLPTELSEKSKRKVWVLIDGENQQVSLSDFIKNL